MNNITSALLVLAIGLNGCAMVQPATMSGPCRDAVTGRYTSCDTGPSGWDRLSEDDRLAVGLTIGVSLAALAVWGIYEMASGSSSTPPTPASLPPPPPTLASRLRLDLSPSTVNNGDWFHPGTTICMDSNGNTLYLSANFDCVANGFTRPYVPTAQTTTGGPVYVHGYTRTNGTYVAPYTRRR